MDRETRRKKLRESYWRRTVAKEQKVTEQMILVANKTLTIGQKRFPRGAILPEDAISKYHLRALIEARPCGARYERREENRTYPEAIDLPPPAPADPSMTEKEILDLLEQLRVPDDLIASWRRLVNACNEHLGGKCNTHWLEGHIKDRCDAARELFKLANAEIHYEARRKGIDTATVHL